MNRTLTKLLFAASMLAGACTATSRPATHDTVNHDPIAEPAPRIDRAKLRAALGARRTVMFARFLAYREGKVYPTGDGAGFEHVWLDSFGHLCAAATMISADWGFVATSNVALKDNHIALATVHDGALSDWVLTSGLTHHEIVAIQRPGFRPEPPDLGMVPAPPEEAKPVEVAAVDPALAEIQRQYDGYIDVERQLTSMWEESLDDATDALMKHPELARELIAGLAAGPGEFAEQRVATAFAKPPA